MRPTKSVETASPSTLAWWRCPGLVYFLSVGTPPVAIKIGMLAVTLKQSRRSAMRRRLANIQSANHELVRVLGAISLEAGEFPTKAAEDLERQLHLEFSHLARFKLNTRGAEWFSASPVLLARIQEIAKPPEELNIPRIAGFFLARTDG